MLTKEILDYIAIPEIPKVEDYRGHYVPGIDDQYLGAALDKYYLDLKQWQEKYEPLELLEWKDTLGLVTNEPIYIKIEGEIDKVSYWKNPTVSKPYIEADIYEAAIEKQKWVNWLGEGWIYKSTCYWVNGKLGLIYNGAYFTLELDEKIITTWHESICTPKMILDVIKEIEK